jgi:hypothetical protein
MVLFNLFLFYRTSYVFHFSTTNERCFSRVLTRSMSVCNSPSHNLWSYVKNKDKSKD